MTQRRRRFFIICFVFATFLSSLWLVQRSIRPPLPQPDAPAQIYSNQSRQDLRLIFTTAIQRAKQSIHLIVFGLSDSAIIQTLENKISSGIATKVYYDPKGASPLKLVSPISKSSFIPVKRRGLMHQKILVIDHDLILIGSANMTKTSLRMHDNLVIGFRSPKMARFLIQHAPFSPGYLRSRVGGQDVELWLLPDPKGNALKDLKRHIRSASRSISIAVFTLTHPALLDEIIDAKKRGVKVSIVIDAHSGLGASAKAIERLRAEKIPIFFSRGLQLLHHKFILIDQTTLVTGSANWTKAAFARNSDCLLILHSLTSEQKHFMNTLWNRIKIEATAES